MTIKWKILLIPGLMAFTQLSTAAEDNFIDQILSDDGLQLETEAREQPLQDENFQTTSSTEEESSASRDKLKTRFGIGYEYRQSLKSDSIERPELPDRPQRPERPDRPGRFGQ